MKSGKILFLNLPNREQITRRYMCSYTSPESLLPPIELISLASVAREAQLTVHLLDAIAEKKDEQQVVNFIQDFQPKYITVLIGFECYQEDIDCINRIKSQFKDITIITFGYYATQFPEETLKYSNSDFIILGEPDYIFQQFLESEDKHSVNGICYLNQCENLVRVGNAERIKDFKKIPIPAYDLLPKGKYYEPFVELPYGMIQTMRGCPYQCNYCVKSFGTFTSSLTSDEIIEHINTLIDLHQVKTIRFIDDTFTLNRKRVVEICEKIIENNLKIKWMCLSRLDNLDEELLQIMAQSGCKRIYLGIESGSSSILEKLNKKMDVQSGIELLKNSSKLGIEFAGFFLGCLPFESEEEFQESIDFALQSKINFMSYNPMTPYPGTDLFKQFQDNIDFSIYPYKNEWKSDELYKIYSKRKKIFYRKFYLRFNFIAINYRLIFRHLKYIPTMSYRLIRSLISSKYFVIGGIKYKQEA